MRIKKWVKISNEKVTVNGSPVLLGEDTSSLKAIYNLLELDYSKFFKMDGLSKIGTLASHLLLKDEVVPGNCGIFISTSSGCMESDEKHQKSIINKEEYFPSPATFVYTLSNIVIGEIAIKNKLQGEHLLTIEKEDFEEYQYLLVNQCLQNTNTTMVIAGRLEKYKDTNFAMLYLVDTNSDTGEEYTTNKISELLI